VPRCTCTNPGETLYDDDGTQTRASRLGFEAESGRTYVLEVSHCPMVAFAVRGK
jgi:hypothetical protein